MQNQVQNVGLLLIKNQRQYVEKLILPFQKEIAYNQLFEMFVPLQFTNYIYINI